MKSLVYQTSVDTEVDIVLQVLGAAQEIQQTSGIMERVYTQLHKWLPEVNKQKFTHSPPNLQVWVAIGGVAVEAEFFH